MKNAFFAAIFILVIAAIPINVWIFFATRTTVTGLVIQDKDRVTSTDGKSSQYLIFTDQETFADRDSWLALKFNSSDVYGQIQRGQICDFDVTGMRIPILSHYRNILSARCHA